MFERYFEKVLNSRKTTELPENLIISF